MPSQPMTPQQQRMVATREAVDAVKAMAAAGSLAAAVAGLGIPPSPPGQGWTVNRQALVFWRLFVRADGLVPDVQIPVVGCDAKDLWAAAVEDSIVRGRSSARVAADFLAMLSLDRWAMLGGKRPSQEEEEYLVAGVDQFFIREINRAHLSVQVCQGVALYEELIALDEKYNEIDL